MSNLKEFYKTQITIKKYAPAKKNNKKPSKNGFINNSKIHSTIKDYLKSEGISLDNIEDDFEKRRVYKNGYHRYYLSKREGYAKAANKKHYAKNREKLLLAQRKWRTENRERYLEIMRSSNEKKRRAAGVKPAPISKHTIWCDCGGRYTPNNYRLHIQTKRHLRHEKDLERLN